MSQENKYRCRCRGHGAPEIIEPCIRELVDCLNRHGVETIQSCCGHSGPGLVILAPGAIEPVVRDGKNIGWKMVLAAKPVLKPYDDEKGEWVEEYPTGGMAWYGRYPGAPEHG